MLKLFSITVCSALLTACAVGPDFKRPDTPQPQNYTQTALTNVATSSEQGTDTSAQHLVTSESLDAEWWHRFQSDALNAIVQHALDGNRTLVAATWSLAEAQEQANARAGARLPQVNMTAGVGRNKYGAEFLGSIAPPPPFTYFAIGPTVSYTLDYTGGVARSIEQQRAFAEYRHHQLEAAHLAVAGNTVLHVLHIASLNSQIATLKELLDRDKENMQLVQEAFNAGSVSRLDVLSAQSQLANDMTALPPLQQELSMARHALAVMMGNTPADAVLPEFELAQLTLPQNIPLSVPSELAHRRPDILAAEAQLHAATAAAGIAEANLYPRIDLSASIAQQSLTVEQLFDRSSNAWSLISGVVAPIFDGGTLRAKHRAAEDAMHASAANYQQTVLEAFAQVADSLEALDHDADELHAREHAEQAARDNVELTRKSYREGNVGVLQVLDAERLYQQARIGYVRAQAQRYIDTLQLFVALGGAQPLNALRP